MIRHYDTQEIVSNIHYGIVTYVFMGISKQYIHFHYDNGEKVAINLKSTLRTDIIIDDEMFCCPRDLDKLCEKFANNKLSEFDTEWAKYKKLKKIQEIDKEEEYENKQSIPTKDLSQAVDDLVNEMLNKRICDNLTLNEMYKEQLTPLETKIKCNFNKWLKPINDGTRIKK